MFLAGCCASSSDARLFFSNLKHSGVTKFFNLLLKEVSFFDLQRHAGVREGGYYFVTVTTVVFLHRDDCGRPRHLGNRSPFPLKAGDVEFSFSSDICKGVS